MKSIPVILIVLQGQSSAEKRALESGQIHAAAAAKSSRYQ